jgi:hypothetical protein
VLFLVAAICVSLSAGAWWMQRIAFTPDATRSTAGAMLDDPDIRQEINTVVTDAAAPELGVGTAELGRFLEEEILSTRAGAAMMGPLMEEAHERIIGNRDDEPVVITSTQMIEIVRDQRAAEAPNATLVLAPIGVLNTTKNALGWIVLIGLGLGMIALLFGIFIRPERRDVLRGIGEFGLAMAVSMAVFGYLLPVHLLTAIDNRTWTHAIPHLALRTLPVTLGAVAIFAGTGVALLIASRSGGKRRQWSTPLSVARYRGGDNPGWG